MTITLRTDFASGGLATTGLKAAGLTPIYAVEMEADRCEMYRKNIGSYILCSKVEDATPEQMLAEVGEYADVNQISPSCVRASAANSNKGETQTDIDCAVAIVRNIRVMRPKVVMLENVRGYQQFTSFAMIKVCLTELGYRVQHHIVCAADYGVPQTRYRLILVATRSDMPSFTWPEPTHHDGPYQELMTLDGGLQIRLPWVGWYDAIADLIPTLEPDEFAQWQLERLPQAVQTLMLDSRNAGQEWGTRYYPTRKPSFTITKTEHPAHMPRAFIVDGQNTSSTTCREGGPPTFTVTGSNDKGPARALLINARSTSWDATVLEADRPCHTVIAGNLRTKVGATKAWLEQGRVVRMSVRALARFQSVPDSYQFSGNNKLDCGIVGDGVPCKLAEAFGREIVKLFK